MNQQRASVCVAALMLVQMIGGMAAEGQSVAPGTGRYPRRIQISEVAQSLLLVSRQVNKATSDIASGRSPVDTAQTTCKELLYIIKQAEFEIGARKGHLHRASASANLGAAQSQLSGAETTLNQCPVGDPGRLILPLQQTAENARLAGLSLVRSEQEADEPTSWLLPTILRYCCKDGWTFLRSDMTITNQYFNSDVPLTVAGKVKYNYTAADTISTISGDILALQFPYVGFQIALGGNGSNSPSGPSQSTATNTAAPTVQSVEQAIQKLEQGGDFYLRWTLPLIDTPSTKNLQVQAFATSLFGFELLRGGAQNTVNQARRGNGNVAGEVYFQWDSFAFGFFEPPPTGSRTSDSTASIYADLRYGWQSLSKGQAANTGLGSNTSYRLGQLGAGVILKGFAQLSAQKYWGPEQAFTDASGNPVTVNNFKKWQVSFQFTPAVAAGKQ